MKDSNNIIIALILSTLILIGWQYFYVTPRVQEAQRIERNAIQEKNKHDALQPTVKTIDITKEPELLDREVATQDVRRIKIHTEKVNGSISLKGARLDDLTLSEYKEFNNPESPDVELLSPSGTKEVYFAEFGWVSNNKSTPMPTSKTVWYTEQDILTQNHPVTLKWDNNNGLKFVINIAIDENYMFKITRTVVNYGSTDEIVTPYGLVNRSRDMSGSSLYILHEGPIGVFDKSLKEITYQDMIEDREAEFRGAKGWLGITDKFWLTAMIPDETSSFDAKFTYYMKDGVNRFQTDYTGQNYELSPGKNVSLTSHFFAGPKQVGMLDKYSIKLDIPLFDRAVDFGILYFLTKPIFNSLEFFYALLGNFGLAILMLTVIIKIILFPLANKSYISMHKMKSVHPQLLELKERYKDNKVQMNKEVMELYKKEKINPMSGCLPILVQIPVFFALYKVLYVTIEMRHAPFYGWITDLSSPDPTSMYNLFGLFPWEAPAFLSVGAWPLIMGITMIIQQKMNPKPADPVQAKVMAALPYFFIFMFSTFPAGLIIYWAWNNSLSILQQWVITRKLK